ncbi:MAG: exodeoxyribonuclease VII large subunit, partial [Gammaproteobacteria bacterium]
MIWTETHHRDSQLEREILRVSELNRAVQDLLSNHFPLIWVEGELSNLTRAVSGHFYFSLKDDSAQVRCAMFASRNRLLDFNPENGQQVLVRARVGLYPARGDFQLIIEDMEPCGEGLLRLQFEQIKSRLQKAGLFDPEHKKPLPDYPATIGIITSESAAALQDVLHVIERRYPCAELCIYPAQVQGESAPQSICRALQAAETHAHCDVLLVVRGGGSMEDLWAFNDEHVARAIHTCSIPVVTGIGHEIDFTIADFVADQRAPTPSAAAELATPNREELLIHLGRLEKRLEQDMVQHLQDTMQYLDRLEQRLLRQHPETRLSDCRRHL